jgi:hypothetical protein
MDITLSISNAMDARRAWLAAILAAPVDQTGEQCSGPLWAQLLGTAFYHGMQHDPDYTPETWDRALVAAVELAGAVGAPSRPTLDDLAASDPRWTHRTKSDLGPTDVVLFHAPWGSTTGWRLFISGPRAEAVTRRAHAAARALEALTINRAQQAMASIAGGAR